MDSHKIRKFLELDNQDYTLRRGGGGLLPRFSLIQSYACIEPRGVKHTVFLIRIRQEDPNELNLLSPAHFKRVPALKETTVMTFHEVVSTEH